MPKSRYYPRYYGGGGGGRRSSRSYYSTTRTAKKPKVGWEQYTKDQLKDHCRDRQLSTTGNKGDLIRRLEQYFSKKDAEAAAAAEEKKRAAEMADDAAMLDALEMVEQNQKMASSTPQKSDMPSLSQSSISSSQSNAPSPKKLTLTQEQRELIERKRQAALLRRQNSLNSYNSSNLTLSQSSNCSSPTAARAARKPDAVVLSPVVNPYARKPSPIKAESYATAASSPPRQNFQSNPTEPVLPPLPLDSPPIRQYTLDKLSDMQLKVVEAARPPTATALSASNGNVGPDEKCNQSGSFHPIVRVTAAAGTGKTTTLLHLALRCIDLNHKQLTYVTYSKASAVDAQTRIQALLPDYKKSCIEASTLHSCVMRILSKHARENELDEERGVMFEDKFRKLINEVCGKSIENYLEKAYDHVGNVGLQTRKMYDQVLFWIAKSFNSFCIKDISLEDLKDESNVMRHYYPLKARFFRPGEIAEKLGFPLASYSDVKSYKFYADQCVVLWEHIIDNGIRTFDVEMKRAQLAGVRIPGSVLLVDECQDLDECQVDLIAKQLQYGTAIFFVGDAAQTIYSFRGAKSSNYMSLKNAIDLCLNKSWRFGPSIARIANVALFAKEYSPQTNNYLFKAKKQWIPYRIEGARGEEESSVLKDSLLGKSKEVGTITFIARTNYALMFKAMEIMGLGSLVGGQSDDESDSDESKSDRPGEPVSLNLENVPKFHINGKGDMSGLKKWHKTSKEIRQL